MEERLQSLSDSDVRRENAAAAVRAQETECWQEVLAMQSTIREQRSHDAVLKEEMSRLVLHAAAARATCAPTCAPPAPPAH